MKKAKPRILVAGDGPKYTSRRTEPARGGKTASSFRAGDLHIDLGQRRVFIGDHEVSLTPTECHLLSELVRQAGRVVLSGHLLQSVWGIGSEECAALRQAIYRLRQKIEPDPQNPCYIQTRTGLGYIFVLPE